MNDAERKTQREAVCSELLYSCVVLINISINLKSDTETYYCKTLVIPPKCCKEKRTFRQAVVYRSTHNHTQYNYP